MSHFNQISFPSKKKHELFFLSKEQTESVWFRVSEISTTFTGDNAPLRSWDASYHLDDTLMINILTSGIPVNYKPSFATGRGSIPKTHPCQAYPSVTPWSYDPWRGTHIPSDLISLRHPSIGGLFNRQGFSFPKWWVFRAWWRSWDVISKICWRWCRFRNTDQNIFHVIYKPWFWKGEFLDKPHFWSCKMGCILEIPPVTSGCETTKSLQR